MPSSRSLSSSPPLSSLYDKDLFRRLTLSKYRIDKLPLSSKEILLRCSQVQGTPCVPLISPLPRTTESKILNFQFQILILGFRPLSQQVTLNTIICLLNQLNRLVQCLILFYFLDELEFKEDNVQRKNHLSQFDSTFNSKLSFNI